MNKKAIDHFIDHAVGFCEQHPGLNMMVALAKTVIGITLFCLVLSVTIPILVVIILVIGKVLLPISVAIFTNLTSALNL